LIKCKEHLTKKGLRKIVSIKSVLNNGLSNDLKTAFPYIEIVTRPQIKNHINFDPYWISGFVDAEGCFFISVVKTPIKTKIGVSVRLKFYITQHLRDEKLLINLAKFLDCGKCYTRTNKILIGDYITTGFKDITEKIIPFFDKYPIIGSKSQDFLSFKRVSELMKSKAHLKESGLKEILLIKSTMNKSKTFLSNKNSSLTSSRIRSVNLNKNVNNNRNYSTRTANCAFNTLSVDSKLEVINKKNKQQISFFE
jgi:LAGLIDADG endonuclease